MRDALTFPAVEKIVWGEIQSSKEVKKPIFLLLLGDCMLKWNMPPIQGCLELEVRHIPIALDLVMLPHFGKIFI